MSEVQSDVPDSEKAVSAMEEFRRLARLPAYVFNVTGELKAAAPPEKIKMFDGYLTITFGVPHFHICIGEHRGPHNNPVSPALAAHRRTSRAEMYRRLSRAGTPISWGVRLLNGKGEQQITILLPNPFLHPETDKILKVPDWSRLTLWDELRARWFNLPDPDPFDRSGRGFRHD